jgi:SLBB domain
LKSPAIPWEKTSVRCRRHCGPSFVTFRPTFRLRRLCTVRVYVVGDVVSPVAYDISSLSTVLNALYAAGGPSSRGSLRPVRHLRGERVVNEFDTTCYCTASVTIHREFNQAIRFWLRRPGPRSQLKAWFAARQFTSWQEKQLWPKCWSWPEECSPPPSCVTRDLLGRDPVPLAVEDGCVSPLRSDFY